MFKLAAVLCEYGIGKDTAEQYIWTKYAQGSSFSEQEMVTTIRSAYKKASYGIKYFEDKDTFQRVRQKLKSGIADDDIKKQLNVREDVIEDIKKEIQTGDDIFWSVNEKGTITIKPSNYSEGWMDTFGVQPKLNDFVEENDWYFEWYDAGTMMVWPS